MNRVAILPHNEKQKALAYTMGICVVLLLLLFLVRWTRISPPEPIAADIIEVENLGNDLEGFGEQQPLKKGNPTPTTPSTQPSGGSPVSAVNQPSATPDQTSDAANLPPRSLVNKPNSTRTNNPGTGTNPTPKLTFPGKQQGPNGNNPNEDNDFNSQGNNPNSGGDIGNQQGKPMEVVTKSVTQSMVQNYEFADQLKEAKVSAVVEVNSSGKGRFVQFAKGSSSSANVYKNAIIHFLPQMDFTKNGSNYLITVIFNFKVN
jgi:hypothetical protein